MVQWTFEFTIPLSFPLFFSNFSGSISKVAEPILGHAVLEGTLKGTIHWWMLWFVLMCIQWMGILSQICINNKVKTSRIYGICTTIPLQTTILDKISCKYKIWKITFLIKMLYFLDGGVEDDFTVRCKFCCNNFVQDCR